MPMNESDGRRRLLTETETADYLNLSRSTLRQQRMKKQRKSGMTRVPFIRIGRNIRYDLVDLDEWIVSQRVVPN